MLIQRVTLLSVVDLGREGVQGGPFCLPLSLLSGNFCMFWTVLNCCMYSETAIIN